MTWNDHDHRGEYAEDRHDHDGDYAEKYHRHYDLEKADEHLQGLIREIGGTLSELRSELQAALDRIRVLEGDRAGVLAQLRVLDRLRPTCVLCHDATADRQTVNGPACTDCVGDLPDDGPGPGFPETWAFDGAQEAQAGEPEHGPAADTFTCCTTPMPWPARDQDRTCPDCGTIWEREQVDIGAGARIKSAGCAETSDGEHCGDWHDGGRCGACGLLGPGPDEDQAEEPEPYDPGPEIDDEGGMSEHRYYVMPEDNERGQS